MRLEKEQYEEIKQTVIDTFSEFDIQCIPISAFELATKMGLTIVPYSSLEMDKREAAIRISKDGFSFEPMPGKWLIYYNDEMGNYERVNRTIMHEIGHYALGHTKTGSIEEAEANFFAKYALTPPPLVHTLGVVINVTSIKRAFRVSHRAASYAYKYYKRWLNADDEYTDYELQLLQLFKVA